MESLARFASFYEFKSVTNALLFVIGSCILWNLFSSFRWWLKTKDKRPPGPYGNLPFVGLLPFLGKEPHKALWDMRKKYGDIIGFYMGSKYTVILNEYTVMKEVVSHSSCLDRAPGIFDHIPHLGFINKNGEEWIEQRRFCLSAARDLGLGRGHWEELINDETTNFIQKLENFKGKPSDIHHILGSSISSNIISLLIGRKLDEKKESDKIEMAVEFADASFTYTGPSNPTTVVPGLRRFCEIFSIAGYGRAYTIYRKFSSFIRDEIVRHKMSTTYESNYDFINIYLEKLSKLSAAEKHYFSEVMLEGNVNILYLGSSDTIFSSLGWMFRLMAKHKDIQEKVYQELMDVLGKDGTARYEERNKIPYTFATVMEGQRFGSIVPISTPRKVIDDIEINGYVIPKGAEVVGNIWALHFNPEYWDNPEEFRPERFLTDGGTKVVRQPPSFAPFSLGRRNCPGETIAWMEILSYFTEIIKKFEISMPPGVEPEFNIVNGLVAHLTPQDMCFIPRKVSK